MAEFVAIETHAFAVGDVTAILGNELLIVKVALGPAAVKAFPARSESAPAPTEILAVPLPEHPLMDTVAVVEDAMATDLLHPAVVPFKVIAVPIVDAERLGRFVSEKVSV